MPVGAGRRGALVLGLAIGLVLGLLVGLVVRPGSSPDGRAPVRDDGSTARSVILINGDGMGAAHREAARLDQHGRDGALLMDSMPAVGFQSTSSADPDDVVTDSAAAATAWATGRRTSNGAISVDVDGAPLPTLGAQATAAGRATGLVTTAQVTDASPAAFFSSVPDRDQQAEIARQYVEETQPDVILGGGAASWPAGLIATAEQEGYTVVPGPDGLAQADGDRLLGLFADEELFPARPVALGTMTATALEVLSRDPDGFFLLVEEEGVDAASHANDGAGLLEAMRSLEDAVRVARDYVAAHPDTLLIVTGDHDTGGLAVEDAPDGSERPFMLDWTTTGHTSAPTPVTAEGPGSEQLVGFYPNTHLYVVMREALTS